MGEYKSRNVYCVIFVINSRNCSYYYNIYYSEQKHKSSGREKWWFKDFSFSRKHKYNFAHMSVFFSCNKNFYYGFPEKIINTTITCTRVQERRKSHGVSKTKKKKLSTTTYLSRQVDNVPT